MIEFAVPQLSDRALIQGYYDQYPSRSCERTFAFQYLWAPIDGIRFAEVEGTLVMSSLYQGKTYFAWPAGPKDRIPAALTAIEHYAAEELGEPLRFYQMTPAQFEQLQAMMPGDWAIRYHRDLADYIYDREKLATLAGKKLHSKRNHINRFIERHPDWRCEPLGAANAADAEQVALRWRDDNDCSTDPEKDEETCVALHAIREFDALHLDGAVLYTEEGPVAFTIGERLSEDTFLVHVEKADAAVQGAYPMINREFVRQACEGYTYVNRMEDTGAEGLRKAKLSYHPEFLEEKGTVTRSGEEV